MCNVCGFRNSNAFRSDPWCSSRRLMRNGQNFKPTQKKQQRSRVNHIVELRVKRECWWLINFVWHGIWWWFADGIRESIWCVTKLCLGHLLAVKTLVFVLIMCWYVGVRKCWDLCRQIGLMKILFTFREQMFIIFDQGSCQFNYWTAYTQHTNTQNSAKYCRTHLLLWSCTSDYLL